MTHLEFRTRLDILGGKITWIVSFTKQLQEAEEVTGYIFVKHDLLPWNSAKGKQRKLQSQKLQLLWEWSGEEKRQKVNKHSTIGDFFYFPYVNSEYFYSWRSHAQQRTHRGFTGIDFYFHMNTVPELWSMAMPNPSALFCFSNACRSRTLESHRETPSNK